jgi:hypothetical protein
MSRPLPLPLFLLWLLVAGSPAAATEAPGLGGRTALLSLQDRSGDPALAGWLEEELAGALAAGDGLVPLEESRAALRQRRLRTPERAPAPILAQVAAELGADHLLTVTLHDGCEEGGESVPRLSASALRYDAAGRVVASAFVAKSGIDRRRLLGLGAIPTCELLAPRLARELLAELAAAPAVPARPHPGSAALGRVALFPLGGTARAEATLAAETATAALRTALVRHGVELVPLAELAPIADRQQRRSWGAVDEPTRRALAADCGADVVLTGNIELFDADGGHEPRPRVNLALRLIDAKSGRILWIDGDERDGWSRSGPFGLGRIHSRGALLQHMVDLQLTRLLRAAAQGWTSPRSPS